MKSEECIFSTTSQLVNLWRLHLTKPTALLTATPLSPWKRPRCAAQASSGRHREAWMNRKRQEPPLELSPSPGCGCVGVAVGGSSLTNASLPGNLRFRRGCPHGSAPQSGPSRRGSGRGLPGPPAPRAGDGSSAHPRGREKEEHVPGPGPASPPTAPQGRLTSPLARNATPPLPAARRPLLARGGSAPPLPSLLPSLPPSLPSAAAAAAAAAPVPPPRPPPRPALPHPGPGAAVTMVMAEGTAVLRRNRPGTKAQVRRRPRGPRSARGRGRAAPPPPPRRRARLAAGASPRASPGLPGPSAARRAAGAGRLRRRAPLRGIALFPAAWARPGRGGAGRAGAGRAAAAAAAAAFPTGPLPLAGPGGKGRCGTGSPAAFRRGERRASLGLPGSG